MSNIEDIVDSLENKISKILHKLEVLKQTNLKLKDELVVLEQSLQEQKQKTAVWEDKHEALKIANSMLGSDESKRETKLKINALIRDIDLCIAQLAD